VTLQQRVRLIQLIDEEIIATEDQVRRLRQMRAILTEGRTRVVRNYDVPPMSGEEIARLHGIELHPADEPDTTPAWFRERHGATSP